MLTPAAGVHPTVPRSRRLTVLLAPPASVVVALTSFHAVDLAVMVPLTTLWLAAFCAGALWRSGGRGLLIGLAATVKVMTLVIVVLRLALHSRIGPQGPLDWIPLGSLNAATGIWFLKVIRGSAE